MRWQCGFWPVMFFGLLLAQGCATWNPPKWKMPWSKPEIIESKYGHAARMVVIWTPDVLSVVGRPPTRGFGGRVYFYNDYSEAIPVEGQLLVYAFDDSDPETAATTAQKRFAFTPEQFTQHFSESDLGASYSIWIPWDSGSSDQKTISLLPVFTSVSGHHVVGQQSLNVLPGRKTNQIVRKEDWKRRHGLMINGPVAPISYDEQIENSDSSGSDLSMRTTTINMPRTLARQMAGKYDVSPPTTADTDPGAIARNLEAYNTLQQQQQAARQAMSARARELKAPQSRWQRSGQSADHSEPHQFPAPASPNAQLGPYRRP